MRKKSWYADFDDDYEPDLELQEDEEELYYF